MKKIKRVLISLSDKSNLTELAACLKKFNVEFLSTGGTAKALVKQGIDVFPVDDYISFPEIMGGRLKTFHPKIHGGILGRRSIDNEVMAEHGILEIDLVVVNLYPFKKTIETQGVTFADAVANVDIGGVAMLRGAAKNHNDVAVLCDPNDYKDVIDKLNANNCSLDFATRMELATKAFSYTANYDGIISNYFGKIDPNTKNINNLFPPKFSFQYTKSKDDMRYGENPHQKAALYVDDDHKGLSIVQAQLLQGKQLSYNNIADADTALECVNALIEPSCVIVKHANPCGVASNVNIRQAYVNAFACDPTSAFGGIIAFNRKVDTHTILEILKRQFVEIIIAPSITDEALLEVSKKKNVRILITENNKCDVSDNELDFKKVRGGLLVQELDNKTVTLDDVEIVTKLQPNKSQLEDLLFAWKVVKFVKSNAIVYAKNKSTVGIGAGQMSRVFSSKIAINKANDAGLQITQSVLASDAFFPFKDSLDIAHQAGVSCIIQPGGSMRDSEVIQRANEFGMSMIFTRVRHFRH